MSLFKLFRKLWPFVKPYRWLVICTLVLTLIGSTIAQVNAIVLDRTVDAINSLIGAGGISWREASKILIVITAILLGKEFMWKCFTTSQVTEIQRQTDTPQN